MWRVESASVIDHLEAELAGVAGETDHDPTSVSVVLDVVQRFLRDADPGRFRLFITIPINGCARPALTHGGAAVWCGRQTPEHTQHTK